MSKLIKSSLVTERKDNTKEKKDTDKKINIKYEELIKDAEKKAKRKSERMIEEAKQNAQEIVNNANKTSEEIKKKENNKKKKKKKEAENIGYEEGFKKGFDEGKEKSDQLIREASQIKESCMKQKNETLNNLESDIIELVMEISKKAINRLYDEDKEILLSIIKKGLDTFNSPTNITIKVSQEDYDFVEMHKNKIHSMANLVEDITIAIDNTLHSGGVLIETSNGSVDTSINTQIEEIEKMLKELLNSE